MQPRQIQVDDRACNMFKLPCSHGGCHNNVKVLLLMDVGGTMDDQLSADGRSAANDVNEATMNLNADLFAASDAVDGGAGAGAAGGGAEQAALGDAGGGMGATHVWQGSS